MINSTLFNAAIPAVIILLCFLFKIEKTNKFQILGLIISVGGILAIVTRLKLDILLSLNFNKGDLIMIGGVITWGVYSTLLMKKKFTLPLLTLVHVISTFGLICVFPQFLYEFSNGQVINFDINLVYTLIFLALFPSIGSYYCWAGAVSIIGANRAGISLSLIPLFGSIMAIAIYDETFQFFHLIGAILIILGLFCQIRKLKMLKVAILDDYQNVSQQFIDIEKLSGKYEIKIFSEPFTDEAEVLEQLADFEALLIMREERMTKNVIDNLTKLKFIITSGTRNKSIDLKAAKKENYSLWNRN